MLNGCMSRLKKIRSHKKKILLLLSISLVFIGFLPQITITIIRDLNDPYTVEPLALESEDGTYISSFIYTPEGEKSHGGVVVSHHYLGDKTIMEPISVELVRRGFTVISIDFRGHGASGGQFVESKLIKDVKAAVDYFESELPYITQIGLVGHSLGASTAAKLARIYPNRINATVAIGSINFNPSGIPNLLMARGGYDPKIHGDSFLNALRLYTGEQNVSIGQLYYGDFVGGNNTMAFVGAGFPHLLEMLDPSITYQTIQWFEQVFNGAYAEDIILTEWYLEFLSLGSQIGTIILTFILIVYLSDILFRNKINREKEEVFNESNNNGKRLISYFALLIMGFAVIFFNFLLGGLRDTKQFDTAKSILFISIGAALGGFLIYLFIIMSSEGNLYFKTSFLKIKPMTSTHLIRTIVFGTTSALLSILALSLIWDLPYQNILLTSGKIGILIILVIVSLPLYLIKELYFRTIQSKLKKSKPGVEYIKMILAGILMDNFIIFLIYSVGWINTIYVPVDILYLSVWIRFSFIQNVFATWIYSYSRRNIIVSTIASSIIYAWISVIIFPSYGFP